MQKLFLPAQTDFFELFHKIADELLIVAQQFPALLEDLNNSDNCMATIEIHEQRASHIINLTLERLHKTFITPFDRYDIHRFIKKLDDTVSAVQRTCKRITIYKLKTLPLDLSLMAGLCLQSAIAIHGAIHQLSSLSNSSQILTSCDTVNDLENQAEVLLLKGVATLFAEESDIRQLLKIKEIYEYAKSTLNSCQLVSNIIKDIVLEYS